MFARSIRSLICVLFTVLLAASAPVLSQSHPSDDAYVVAGNADLASGSLDHLAVAAPGTASYIRFDLSNLPADLSGQDIAKATVALFVSKVQHPGTFRVMRAERAWSEQTLTIANAPLPGPEVSPSVSVTDSSAGQFLVIDVTLLVRDWIDGVQPNFGIVLVPADDVSVAFDSKENTATGHDPELNVLVRPQPEDASSVAIEPSGASDAAPAEASGSKSSAANSNTAGQLTVGTRQVVNVTSEPGVDASQKLNACGAALQAAGGGVCDARDFGASVQTISTSVSAGSHTAPVTFVFDAATVFVPAASNTQMFTLVDGMSIEGTLMADVTGMPGWNSAVIANRGTIGFRHEGTLTHVGRVFCKGNDGSAGECLHLEAHSQEAVSYLDVEGLQVEGMNSGIHLVALETVAGVYAWVNGNWFHNVMCMRAQSCFRLEALGSHTTTQVSQNHFPDAQVEIDNTPGLSAVVATANGAAHIDGNSWPRLVIFDALSGSNTIQLSRGTVSNKIEGALCFAACGIGTTFTDEGSGNIIIDWKNNNAPMGGAYSFVTQQGAREGYLVAASHGVELDVQSGYDLRIYNNNGGLGVLGGSGTDHNLYLNNLDPNASGQIVFNKALQAPSARLGSAQIGDTSTYLPIFDANGVRLGYLIYGAHGPELDIAPSMDLRIFSNNAGLKVVGGTNPDKAVYLDNTTSGGAIVFRTPIAAGGGAPTRLACWKSDGQTLGYATMTNGVLSACN